MSLPKVALHGPFPSGTIPQTRRRRHSGRRNKFGEGAGLIRYEAIPDPRDRVDEVWLFGVALDLLAQAVDVSVDGARLDLDLVAPHLAEQLAAAPPLAGLRGQQRQEIELGQRQGDFLTLAPHLAAVHVDDEAWELEARLGLCLRNRLLAPTQVCAHPG